MLPIGDENTCRRGSAVATWTIIAINVAVYIFIQGFGAARPTLALAVIPSEIAGGMGWLKLLSSQFAHAGLAHLAGNMLFLGIFGDNVECRIGRRRFIALYLISGTMGVLAHVAAAIAIGGPAAEVPLVGASAAISGVLAAYLVLFPGNKIMVLLFNFIPTRLSAWLVIGFWFIIQIMGGLSGLTAGGTAYLAHIGGFISSWLWARHYKKLELERITREKKERLQRGESGGIRWWIVDGED
ncbi:MAG: rhomboid family intramembrane serine protease [Rectinemataceae bacterium]|nr:rhomboid family intramembrane serine protease [Rectinemataceae bacterium]